MCKRQNRKTKGTIILKEFQIGKSKLFFIARHIESESSFAPFSKLTSESL